MIKTLLHSFRPAALKAGKRNTMREIRATISLSAVAVPLIALQAECLSCTPQTTLDVSVSLQIPQMLDTGWSQGGSLIDMTGANAITPADMPNRPRGAGFNRRHIKKENKYGWF
jgi:hypothetical protein